MQTRRARWTASIGVVVVLVVVGASLLVISVVRSDGGQDAEVSARSSDVRTEASTGQLPPVDAAKVQAFRDAVVLTPWGSSTDSGTLTSVEPLPRWARGAVFGTIVSARVAVPIPFRFHERQDEFEWGPKLAESGVMLTVQVDSATAGVRDLPSMLDIRIPLTTGQDNQIATSYLHDRALEVAPIGARIAAVVAAEDTEYEGWQSDNSLIASVLFVAPTEDAVAISLDENVDLGPKSFAALTSELHALWPQ